MQPQAHQEDTHRARRRHTSPAPSLLPPRRRRSTPSHSDTAASVLTRASGPPPALALALASRVFVNSANSSSLSPQSRLSQVSRHIAPMAATAFTADVVPQAPEDALFGLAAAYRRDESPNKVDLGIGAYRDNNAKPWVLPVVKQVRR